MPFHSVFLDLDLGNLQKLSSFQCLTRALKSSDVRRQAVNCALRRRQGVEMPFIVFVSYTCVEVFPL